MIKIAVLFVLLLAVSVHGETFGTIGTPGDGASSTLISSTHKWAFRHQMNAETGTATELHFIMHSSFSNGDVITGAIYSDNSDDPLTLLATSSTTATISTEDTYVEYSVEISLELESEVWYWLTVQNGGPTSVDMEFLDATTGNRKFNIDPLPLETTFSAGGNGAEEAYIWIVYTTGEPAAAGGAFMMIGTQ